MPSAMSTTYPDGPDKLKTRSSNRTRKRGDRVLPPASRIWPLPGTALCMAIIALTVFLGGGGTTNPQNEMVLEVLTFLLMVPLVASKACQRGLGKVPGAAWLLAGLVLFIPLVQLVPLPPSIWQAFPGRAIEIQSLAVAGARSEWMPISMAPARTFASMLAMISAVLVFLQVSRLSVRERTWICATIAAMGGLSLLVGVLQLSHTGGLEWSLYSRFHTGFLVGFQANRNAEVDVLQIVMLAIGVLAAARLSDRRHHAMTWVSLMLAILALILGVFLTGSRTGISLAPLTLIIIAAMLLPSIRSMRRALAWLGGGSVVFLGTAFALWQVASVRKVLDRFTIANEGRPDLWTDTIYSIHQVWPFGSGVGTIVPMLEAAERLEVVDPSRPVRAHNDWLEWTLEGGLPGLIVLALIAFLVLGLLIRAFIATRGPDGDRTRRAQAVFATGVILLEGLHSIVDYPMRSMSLAALTGVAVAFLTIPAAAQRYSE